MLTRVDPTIHLPSANNLNRDGAISNNSAGTSVNDHNSCSDLSPWTQTEINAINSLNREAQRDLIIITCHALNLCDRVS